MPYIPPWDRVRRSAGLIPANFQIFHDTYNRMFSFFTSSVPVCDDDVKIIQDHLDHANYRYCQTCAPFGAVASAASFGKLNRLLDRLLSSESLPLSWYWSMEGVVTMKRLKLVAKLLQNQIPTGVPWTYAPSSIASWSSVCMGVCGLSSSTTFPCASCSCARRFASPGSWIVNIAWSSSSWRKSLHINFLYPFLTRTLF